MSPHEVWQHVWAEMYITSVIWYVQCLGSVHQSLISLWFSRELGKILIYMTIKGIWRVWPWKVWIFTQISAKLVFYYGTTATWYRYWASLNGQCGLEAVTCLVTAQYNLLLALQVTQSWQMVGFMLVFLNYQKKSCCYHVEKMWRQCKFRGLVCLFPLRDNDQDKLKFEIHNTHK